MLAALPLLSEDVEGLGLFTRHIRPCDCKALRVEVEVEDAFEETTSSGRGACVLGMQHGAGFTPVEPDGGRVAGRAVARVKRHPRVGRPGLVRFPLVAAF